MNSFILIAAAILNPRARRRRAAAAAAADIEATNADLTEPLALPSLSARPSSTLEAENQGTLEKGTEDEKAPGTSMPRADNTPISKPLTVDADGEMERLTHNSPPDTRSVEIPGPSIE
jgi:hypothetical protein